MTTSSRTASRRVALASVRVVSRRKQIENGSVFSVRQAAAACNVSPPVVRRWLSLGLLSAPPWTVEQLRTVRDLTDPQRHRPGSSAAHGTMARWNSGCSCARCPDCGHSVGKLRRGASMRSTPETPGSSATFNPRDPRLLEPTPGGSGLSAAHGWVALLNPLTPGSHEIVITDPTDPNNPVTTTIVSTGP
jgi:hypothetical protein